MKNPYEVLGVSSDAPDFVIAAAYRACLKKYHPDKYDGSDSVSRTSEILDAFNKLKTSELRAKVDAGLVAEKNRPGNESNTATPPPHNSPSHKEASSADVKAIDEARSKNFVPAFAIMLSFCLFALGSYQLFEKESGDDAFDYYASTDDVDSLADVGFNPYLETETVASAFSNEGEIAADLAASSALAAMRQESPALIPRPVPTVSSLSFDPPAVSFAGLERASQDFIATFEKSGIQGARKSSERCHKQAIQQSTWEAIDYCVAFDYSANAFDRSMTRERGLPRTAYFEFQAVNTLEAYSSRSYLARDRIVTIRRGAEAALLSITTEAALLE